MFSMSLPASLIISVMTVKSFLNVLATISNPSSTFWDFLDRAS